MMSSQAVAGGESGYFNCPYAGYYVGITSTTSGETLHYYSNGYSRSWQNGGVPTYRYSNSGMKAGTGSLRWSGVMTHYSIGCKSIA